MNLIKILAIATMFFMSCKNNGTKTETQPAAANIPSAATSDLPTVADTPNTPKIPGVPADVMLRLINECTFVDYIFHKLPFSLSQSEDPSIDQNISFIDFERPLGHIPTDCKPMGRKFFQIKGTIVYDVDVYLSTKCKFYVFVDKNNKPMYANYMTDAAVKFYANTAQQARSSIGNH